MHTTIAQFASGFLMISSFLTAYCAEDTFCVFKSTDLGRSWIRSDSGLRLNVRINAFGASGDSIFVGTDEGLYISRNMAQSWQVAKISEEYVGRILCISNSSRVAFAGTENYGILFSVDNGLTWNRCETFVPKKVRCMLVLEDRVYAGTDAEGVFVSSDSGKSWQSLQQDFPESAQVFAVEQVGDKLFAGLYSKGLYEWSNQSRHWRKVDNVSPLALASKDGTLVAGHNPGGLFWSKDLGISWSKAKPVVPHVAGELSNEAPVWALAANEHGLFAGASDGIYYSNNQGLTWSRSRAGLPDTSPGLAFYITRDLVLAATIADPISIDEPK